MIMYILVAIMHAVAPGAVPLCSYLLQKLPCICAENPGRPASIYSRMHLPSPITPHDAISTPTTTHTERISSGSNGAPSGRRRQQGTFHHASHSRHPREGKDLLGVYSNEPVSEKITIQTMEQLLVVDKYQAVGFDLEFTSGRAGQV